MPSSNLLKSPWKIQTPPVSNRNSRRLTVGADSLISHVTFLLSSFSPASWFAAGLSTCGNKKHNNLKTNHIMAEGVGLTFGPRQFRLRRRRTVAGAPAAFERLRYAPEVLTHSLRQWCVKSAQAMPHADQPRNTKHKSLKINKQMADGVGLTFGPRQFRLRRRRTVASAPATFERLRYAPEVLTHPLRQGCVKSAQAMSHAENGGIQWRRGWDSNPRLVAQLRFSRPTR